MLQDMDNIEASFLVYFKVGTFINLEQIEISHLDVNTMGMVKLTVQHDLIVGVSFM